MATRKHLEILKQGVDAWNSWRSMNHGVRPDLRKADLSNADLSNAHLRVADLTGANLEMAVLSGADLTEANLSNANLISTMLDHTRIAYADLSHAVMTNANLCDADLDGTVFSDATLEDAILRGTRLREANFTSANLVNADLTNADLTEANFENANLISADLRYAYLARTNLKLANLDGVNFSNAEFDAVDFGGARLIETVFAYNDLNRVQRLESVEHLGPSSIGIETISRSEGKLPEVFLRGCGLSDWEIESVKLYRSALTSEEISDILYRLHGLRADQAIQINPLFISYSHGDALFVDELEGDLNKKGIRFWRDKHHSTAGRLEKQIDRAIRLNPTVLLILSSRSVTSDWVEHEARLARKLEQETGRDVLCPIALDDSWKSCCWPERLREQIAEYQILDFSDWQDATQFHRMFTRLVKGLHLFYK